MTGIDCVARVLAESECDNVAHAMSCSGEARRTFPLVHRKNVEADLIRFKAEGRQQRLDGKPASPSPPKDGGLRKSPKRSSHTP